MEIPPGQHYHNTTIPANDAVIYDANKSSESSATVNAILLHAWIFRHCRWQLLLDLLISQVLYNMIVSIYA